MEHHRQAHRRAHVLTNARKQMSKKGIKNEAAYRRHSLSNTWRRMGIHGLRGDNHHRAALVMVTMLPNPLPTPPVCSSSDQLRETSAFGYGSSSVTRPPPYSPLCVNESSHIRRAQVDPRSEGEACWHHYPTTSPSWSCPLSCLAHPPSHRVEPALCPERSSGVDGSWLAGLVVCIAFVDKSPMDVVRHPQQAACISRQGAGNGDRKLHIILRLTCLPSPFLGWPAQARPSPLCLGSTLGRLVPFPLSALLLPTQPMSAGRSRALLSQGRGGSLPRLPTAGHEACPTTGPGLAPLVVTSSPPRLSPPTLSPIVPPLFWFRTWPSENKLCTTPCPAK